MDREEQIKLLEQKVIEEAIDFCSLSIYGEIFKDDLEEAVERLLDFKKHGSFKADRERIEKEREEAERKARIDVEVNALRSHPDFQNLTPDVIDKYIGEIAKYQGYKDLMMVEAITEALRQSGIELYNSPSVLTWRKMEGDRND